MGKEESIEDILLLSGQNFYNEFNRQPVRIEALVISFCVEGIAEAVICDREYVINKGAMFVKTPGAFSLWDWTSENYTGYELMISMDFLKKLPFDMKIISTAFAYLKNEYLFRLTEEQQENLLHMLRLTEGLTEHLDHYKLQALQGTISSILYFVCSLIRQAEKNFDKRNGDSPNRNRKHYCFLNFLELLGKYSYQERSVAFYADKMALTPKYLSSIIKEVSGKRATEWIDEYVMMEAKVILQHPKTNVAEAAYQLNFSNTSFFGQYFKKHSGMSPGNYKRKYAG